MISIIVFLINIADKVHKRTLGGHFSTEFPFPSDLVHDTGSRQDRARMKRPNIRKLIKQVFRSFIQRDNCLENKFIEYPEHVSIQRSDLYYIFCNSSEFIFESSEGRRLVKDCGHF